MTRGLYVLFGILAYFVFFATFLYLIAFVGAFPWVPRTVDGGHEVVGLAHAIAADLGLVALFGIQHSVMARQGFKRAWTKTVPEAVERSLYVLIASLVLIIMFWFWHPIPMPIWTVAAPWAVYLLWGLFGIGWLIVLLSTFLLNHFELFGLQQVWTHAEGHAPAAPQFRTPLFYARVRHPLYSGFILAFWATPTMTAGHLLLAAGMTLYILIAIRHEERDLVALFGADYEAYRTRAGMLMPKL
jgi:protein-S-isoprenylcysteine O-methyltransferase Ste14